MAQTFEERLNQILPKISSDEFLDCKGLGNEIGFWIFDYPPEREMEMRDFLEKTVLTNLNKSKPPIRAGVINLFDLVIQLLQERKLLDKAIEMQRIKGDDAVMARTLQKQPLKKSIGEVPTICPFDGSGCGFIVASRNGEVENIEGDPDHPINRGAACAKGASLRQLSADNPWRLSKVLYRAPGTNTFTEKTWDWAITEIAQRIKKTRDAAFIEKDSKGNTVNRTEVIANIGGAALDNEECYLLVKLARSLGIVYLEHQARL